MVQRFPFLVVLMSWSAVGCGGPEVQRVTGTVALDGSPLPHVAVVFLPSRDLTLGIIACNESDEEGRFDVVPDSERGQGRAGDYQVIVGDMRNKQAYMAMCMAGLESLTLPSGKRLPPKRYWRQETTPLSAILNKGVNDLDPFELYSSPLKQRND